MENHGIILTMETEVLLPMTTHLEEISQTLRNTLNTPIAMSHLKKTYEIDFLSRAYWWRTDTTQKVIRGEASLGFVQLQIEFDVGIQVVIIDILCIPEEQKGLGKGRKIVTKIMEISRTLNYQTIRIDTQEESLLFWVNMGFLSFDSQSTTFPKAMYFLL